ncbi:pilus assembly protein PilX [Shewanella sp. WXL01]|uniref:pilus assembly PilX family protein n=1 Tax=Shewanella sp. WXL01 TaxID=2709721 RepID=UPI001438468E|nr:pilus assembly PilX N-terminal domain-containing protein [Shewanella sp. WXL01]NKF52763.1 pilus assembly protein PilX [Shewanella sp. WXL01]
MKYSLKKQQGMVLFFALIILVLMTIIGVTLASNSSQSLRMAGASSERVGAKSAAIGAQTLVLKNHQGESMASIKTPIDIEDEKFRVSSKIEPMTLVDVSCQRSSKAYSVDLVNCRRAEVTSTAKFGRNDNGRLTVVSGVEQEVFTGSES